MKTNADNMCNPRLWRLPRVYLNTNSQPVPYFLVDRDINSLCNFKRHR